MPIYVTVYHLDTTIIAKTEGDITLADIDGYLEDIVKAKAVPYRKIFDASSGIAALTDNVGPFAVVTGGNRDGRMADICASISTAKRPMQVFADIHSARRWLDEVLPIS